VTADETDTDDQFPLALMEFYYDASKIDQESLSTAIALLGATDPRPIFYLKLAVGIASSGQWVPDVTTKQLLEAAERVMSLAGDLSHAIGRLQDLSTPAMFGKTLKFKTVLPARLSLLREAVNQVWSVADEGKRAFEKELTGRYAQKHSPVIDLVRAATRLWWESGHKISTTVDSDFDKYINAVYRAAFRKDLESSSWVLEQAKKYSDTF
jgi:hypothetical protein